MPLTVIIFLFLFAGGIILAFIRHPVWGMMSYALSLYAAPAHNWFGPYLPDLRWSLLASLCTLVSIFVNKSQLVPKTPWLTTAPAKIIICYAAWMWIQLLWALSYEAHMEGTILITKYIILYYIIYRVLDNDSTFFTFIMFNLVGGFYISRRVLGYSVGGRVEGIGGPGINDSNTLGMHMSVLLIFAGILLLKKNTLFRNNLHWRICQGTILISAVYIANSVVQTVSRSAVLGVLSGGALLMVIKHWTVKKRLYLYAACAFIGLLYYAPYTFWERLNTITEAAQGEEVEGSAYSRLVIGKAQIEMFKENILGHGHRGTAVLSPYFMPEEYLSVFEGKAGRASHCTFLTTLTEQGLPGAILYVLMVIWAIRIIYAYPKDDPVMYLYFMGTAASLAAIFISGIFVDYLKVEIQVYCFAMLASLQDYQKRHRLRNHRKDYGD